MLACQKRNICTTNKYEKKNGTCSISDIASGKVSKTRPVLWNTFAAEFISTKFTR
jgi:hypothetical protein